MHKLLILAALSAAIVVSQLSAGIREADVTGGRVAGISADGVVSFKGIPFAAPPVGSLRWRSPQPLKPWTGVKQASAFAPGCMQNANSGGRFGAPPALSEDCLYLNVWTPAKMPNDKLPAMVWIYGGAFAAGMTSIPTYDGTHLAQKGVVLVSVAYRVGAFGFLADAELTRENGGTSGDFGLEDMIAGLKWVKSNIAKFGVSPLPTVGITRSALASTIERLRPMRSEMGPHTQANPATATMTTETVSPAWSALTPNE